MKFSEKRQVKTQMFGNSVRFFQSWLFYLFYKKKYEREISSVVFRENSSDNSYIF